MPPRAAASDLLRSPRNSMPCAARVTRVRGEFGPCCSKASSLRGSGRGPRGARLTRHPRVTAMLRDAPRGPSEVDWWTGGATRPRPRRSTNPAACLQLMQLTPLEQLEQHAGAHTHLRTERDDRANYTRLDSNRERRARLVQSDCGLRVREARCRGWPRVTTSATCFGVPVTPRVVAASYVAFQFDMGLCCTEAANAGLAELAQATR